MVEFDSSISYRPIPDFPGYMAGTDGSIWTSKKRQGMKYVPGEWQMLCPVRMPNNYLKVTIPNSAGEHKQLFVHRIILFTFVGPCPPGLVCRHLDGNPPNCRLGNLAWGTHQENHDDMAIHGTRARGERQGASKFKDADIIQIRQLQADGISLCEIARRFSVNLLTISKIVTRRTWAHVASDHPIPILIQPRGEKSPHHKVNEAIVREMRQLRIDGMSIINIGKKFGVHRATVYAIINRKQWGHVK